MVLVVVVLNHRTSFAPPDAGDLQSIRVVHHAAAPPSGASNFDKLVRTEPDREFVARVAAKLPHCEQRAVLELGFGSGQEALELRKQAPWVEITALDRPAESSKRSCPKSFDRPGRRPGELPASSFPCYAPNLQKHNIKVIPHTLPETLPFPDGSFDVVFSRFSLYYFQEEALAKLLTDIHRVLRPEGSLVFMIKTQENLKISIGKVLFPRAKWHSLLQGAGFHVQLEEPERRAEAMWAGKPWIFEAVRPRGQHLISEIDERVAWLAATATSDDSWAVSEILAQRKQESEVLLPQFPCAPDY